MPRRTASRLYRVPTGTMNARLMSSASMVLAPTTLTAATVSGPADWAVGADWTWAGGGSWGVVWAGIWGAFRIESGIAAVVSGAVCAVESAGLWANAVLAGNATNVSAPTRRQTDASRRRRPYF